MAIRSGLGAQVGLIQEVTYGTYIAPTRFLEFVSESLSLSIERIESNAIRAGTTILRTDRWGSGRWGVEGDIELEVATKGFGLIFKNMLGEVAITTPAGGALARDHTHTLGDLFGDSLTIQVGRPGVGGTVHPFSYSGCKIASWELSNEVDGLLALTITVDGQTETTAQALATASFAANDQLLYFTGGAVTVGGSAFDVTNITISGDNGLATERYFLRATTPQLKKEPVQAAFTEITGTMEIEFSDLTAYNRFVTGTTAAVTAEWTGPLIEGALNYGVLVTMPSVRFDGETPTVDGPDILSATVPFKVVDNLTNPPLTLRYRTTDTAS